MKAAIIKEQNKIKLMDVDDPEIEEGDILIEVKACAICGTDIKLLRFGYSGMVLPLTLGHELSGIIKDIKKIDADFKIGDRVTINPNIPCGVCHYCKKDLPTACDNLRTIGIHINGGFANYIKIPSEAVKHGCLFKIPENVSFEEATLIDPASCAINASELSNINEDDIVVIIGAGPAGCLNAEVSKALGAKKTILIQRSEKRLNLSKFTGADVYINSSKQDVMEAVMRETNGRGPDVIIVACASKEAQELSVDMISKRGNINLFGGLPRGESTIDFNSNAIHYKEAFITGTHGGSNAHCKKALDMISSGEIKAKEYLSYEFSLNSFNEAIKVAEEKSGFKVIVKP